MQRTFRLVSSPDAVGRALDDIESALSDAALPRDLVLELRLLGEEAITNVVKYASAVTIEVSIEVSESRAVLEFRDDGASFDPLGRAAPDLDARAEDRPLGGLGIHLIQSIADEVTYQRRDAKNVLRLTKRR